MAQWVSGSLSCVVQPPRFDPPLSLQYRGIGEFCPLELTWGLTPFPKTLLDETINQRLVCAHMHSMVQTPKILTFMF